ncbi:MAG: AAA family ATPase, partial [Candidatus Thiodiazotropha taylori]|nr:AAA family ATPase [Candidatus Thiodiazotropha taylori]MCW4311344.1 AAA family ATPase [Candidatus Thiodiazotropha endolucinida]
MRKVKNALLWLHTNNPLYKHITVPMTVMDNNPNDTHHSSEELNGCLNKEFNIPSCRGEHGASLAQNYLSPQNDCENTCVPLDAHEISLVPLDYQIQRKQQDIPCVRLPTIKNKPVNIFNSSNLEELAFPQLYPYGRNGFSDRKGTELTTHQYFSCRILNKDKRWSSNPQYLFWALHIHEQNYLQSAISVALRNRSKANDPINVNDVRNVHTIDVKTDNYMFMRNLRGTAAYWRSELFKLIAKIRTFGPPTFFLSLSANDMHWYDNFKFIDPAMTDSDIDAMTYMQKCTIIKENPVMCALHFKRRWEAFLYHFLLVKPYPLGIVIDYYARVEFQARGTPHVHLFVWVADAPSFDNVADKDFIVPFIDKYISGQLPDVTSSADLKLVKSLQTHSHTFTCLRKYNTKCRFDFPMHVADSTRLKLMTDTGSYSRFYVLQRTSKDVWVNPYNIKVLRNWNANMDIQMVGSSLGAARYVCSYICKNEPFAFRQTVAECIKSLPQDSSQRKILSKIGNILLTHRTISVQETAYRLLGLNMVYSSRDSVFLSTSLPEERFRTLKSRKQLDELPADSTDIYMHGWPQLYEKRPYGQDFQHMSLSEFITHYNITFYVPKTEKANPRICINIGGQTKILKKRTRPAALQCDIPNVQLNREGHFFSLLYLFYPYRNEHELLLPYRTYEESFKHKQNSIDKNLLEQTNLISQFENSLKALLALEEDQLDDIRALTTPSLQQASDHCNFEGIKQPQNIFTYDILLDPNTTDNPQKHLSVDAFSKMAQPTMTDEEFAENQQMMSDSQRTAFETIQNHDPFCNPPLHLFITGGAGTGKSFLLRLIREYLLRKSTSLLPNVLVAAPTGVAAYNINGLTLHSLLQLPTQDKSNAQYHPLSPRSYKILYEAFKQLKYLIIDEVSMVSYNTLEHIHLRLNEVKEKLLDIEYLFGNVSIICFGDLYQLRPVFGSPIFSQTSQNTALHLWKDIFSLHELTENKRQAKDLSYAQLLNR